MELTKVQVYKMKDSAKLPNMKELIGKTDIPLAYTMTEYTSSDGEIHKVLSILFKEAGMYRTETSAFIESFLRYWEVFGEEADDVKPSITITGQKSQRGNPYINLEVSC